MDKWLSLPPSRRWLHILLLVSLAMLVLPFPARADIAPPDQPAGADIIPDSAGTQVRMLAEMVLIEVQARPSSGKQGQARVTANFIMRNLGSQTESMAVRFPLTFFDGRDNGFGQYPEIQDVVIKVNGAGVNSRRVNYGYQDYQNSPWREFQVNFPAGKDVPIQVSYTQFGVGELTYVSFKYVLQTGAGWAGTIGSADLIVRLPYAANNQNVLINSDPNSTITGWSYTTPGGTFADREIRWHFDELEPTQADDLEVTLVVPSAWQSVLKEQTNVQRNPKDGEAWGRLGKAYKEIIVLRKSLREDEGGLEIYKLAREAYAQAVALLPKDALWHAGFADLLLGHFYWIERYTEKPNYTEAQQGFLELKQALELAPNNAKVQEIRDMYIYSLEEAVQVQGDQITYLWLTATPTLRATENGAFPTATLTVPSIATPTMTVGPTDTVPPASATPSPEVVVLASTETQSVPAATTQPATTPTTEAGKTAGGICGAGLAPLLLILAGWFWRRNSI